MKKDYVKRTKMNQISESLHKRYRNSLQNYEKCWKLANYACKKQYRSTKNNIFFQYSFRTQSDKSLIERQFSVYLYLLCRESEERE